ncbi:GTPase, G3E family [Halalkaliarchaeum desulfuricum]|uniref:GTPase, G3E family n=1 Tax=Halalkaliarchaeum desulfuricum TaxID=2055893 RepID=A0A343TNW7_9EURY|nr:GTP-binding protein [Halalkaliarchaeum desulfuricum]AUX10789.1 GTPase, G3E family [Halalkaliarchaeum desulfuricum]
MTTSKIPVTLLSGSLGAGKTSTLNHLLVNAGNRRIAVLVNDMGEINIDAELLSAGTDVAADGGIAELSNGCICCERQDDLETEVARLADERDFDYLVVEASGISEPEPVARLFTTASRAAAAYELDTLATVVDATQFLETFDDSETVERKTAPGAEDRPLSDLLVEQIETANVLLLNKCDLVDDEELELAEELLSTLNPGAKVVRTVHGQIDPEEILATGCFDPDNLGEVGGAPTFEIDHPEDGHHDHEHDHDHDHATPERTYGITSISYRRRRPFHPERLWEVVNDLPGAVVRSKGLCWLAGQDDVAVSYSQAGPTVRFEAVGPWIAGLPEIERDLYRDGNRDLPWDDEHGDRRTELVFIGHDVDDAGITERLDACLVTDDEWENMGRKPTDQGAGYPTEIGASVEIDLR